MQLSVRPGLGLTEVWYSVIVGILSLGQLAGAIMVGILSRYMLIKYLVLIALGLTTIGGVLYGIINSNIINSNKLPCPPVQKSWSVSLEGEYCSGHTHTPRAVVYIC